MKHRHSRRKSTLSTLLNIESISKNGTMVGLRRSKGIGGKIIRNRNHIVVIKPIETEEKESLRTPQPETQSETRGKKRRKRLKLKKLGKREI